MHSWFIHSLKRHGWKTRGFHKEIAKAALKGLWRFSQKRIPDAYLLEAGSLFIIEVEHDCVITKEKLKDYANFAYELGDTIDLWAYLIIIDTRGVIIGFYELDEVWALMVTTGENWGVRQILKESDCLERVGELNEDHPVKDVIADIKEAIK